MRLMLQTASFCANVPAFYAPNSVLSFWKTEEISIFFQLFEEQNLWTEPKNPHEIGNRKLNEDNEDNKEKVRAEIDN